MPPRRSAIVGAFILSSSGTAHAKQRLGAQVLAREKELCPIADSSARTVCTFYFPLEQDVWHIIFLVFLPL